MLFGVTQGMGYLGFISRQNTCDLTWHFFCKPVVFELHCNEH